MILSDADEARRRRNTEIFDANEHITGTLIPLDKQQRSALVYKSLDNMSIEVKRINNSTEPSLIPIRQNEETMDETYDTLRQGESTQTLDFQ